MKTLKSIIITAIILVSINAQAQVFYLNRDGVNKIEESTIDLSDTTKFKINLETIIYDVLKRKMPIFSHSKHVYRFWTEDGKECSKRYVFKSIPHPKHMSIHKTKIGVNIRTEYLYNKHLGLCTIITDPLSNVLIIYGDTREKNKVFYYDYAE